MARQIVCKFAKLNELNPRILNCLNENRNAGKEDLEKCPYSMYCQNKLKAVNLNQARFCPDYKVLSKEEEILNE